MNFFVAVDALTHQILILKGIFTVSQLRGFARGPPQWDGQL